MTRDEILVAFDLIRVWQQGDRRAVHKPLLVLLAYEYRCCVCAHDLRMGGHAIGLEAAHIKWFQARGPDVVQNGLALCSLHHKIFDLGAFTVLPGNHQIVFSRHLMGGDDTKA